MHNVDTNLTNFNDRRTHLDVNLEGVLVRITQTAHVLQVRRRDGETEVNVRRLHQLLQMVVVMDVVIVVETLMVGTGFQCHRRRSCSLVVVVMMIVMEMVVVVQSSRVCCVRGGFHSDRGWQAKVIGIGRGCVWGLFQV
jgi:hypothetical protein